MNKFEIFLKQVLMAIFKETPFNKQKADENLKEIKDLQKRVLEDSSNGYNQQCN